MTDREMVLEICKSLELQLNQTQEKYIAPCEYQIREGSIILGSGRGYPDFLAEFKFDEKGKLTGHALWE